MDPQKHYDVLIIGGGNAALCAAITARSAGASVLVVEAAPRHFRGGNSRHTRNLRCMHETPADVLTDAYPEMEYWQDLAKVTGGSTDEKLARTVIRQTAECRTWMRAHGVRFQPSLGGTLHLSRTNAFFLGGGKALLNAYYRAAEALGVEIEYNAEVNDLNFREGRFHSANVVRKGFTELIRAQTMIAASGGFQGNLEWLRSAWGEAANNFLIRGTSYDNGLILRLLMDRGALTVADPTQGHCVAIDARAPKFDGGIITRVDCVSLGITVNRDCLRFYDEGEDFWPKRYAIWGRLVAQQPGQIAYTIIDSQAMGAFMPPVFPPVHARTLRELAEQLKLDPAALERTVADYNAAVRPGEFNHSILDNCATEGLAIPKSHWARRIERVPFYAYPLRPGLTFTYLGVKVNESSRVCFEDAGKFDNVFAAGEIMAGNVLGKGYLAGLGMAIGTVFGRIAGKEAARRALA